MSEAIAVTPAGAKAMVNALVAAAPGALDTLDELAAALGDDPNFATTITNQLAGKVTAKSGISVPALTAGTEQVIAHQLGRTAKTVTFREINGGKEWVLDWRLDSSGGAPTLTNGIRVRADVDVAAGVLTCEVTG